MTGDDGRTMMILGGSGLVGRAVARRLLERRPARLMLVGLRAPELQETVDDLRPRAGETEIETAWGDLFRPAELAQLDHDAVLADPERRALLLNDLLAEFNEKVLERSMLYRTLMRYRPDVVVDCLNTATAFAYQDVYRSAQDLLAHAADGRVSREDIERHLLTLPVMQLIRHAQIAAETLRRAEVKVYVKVGTSGTGGMGLNLPYTHSEERPSRMLLTKSALGGAHSLLLFLLARTPGAPATKEIKPTASIGWRDIRYGPIRRGGGTIPRVDCATPLALDAAFGPDARGWTDTGRPLESVYIDMGENGAFAREEFETATSLDSMELITPEEIADLVAMELEARPTGRDVVAALDSATSGPTYRGGVLRGVAVERLRRLEEECGTRSIAFEMLGPPRLSKLLYEAHIWSRLCPTVEVLGRSDAADLARQGADLIARDPDLRSTIVSVGLPIVVSGNRVYRGAVVVVPMRGSDSREAAARGWVDLRRDSAAQWIARATRIAEQAAGSAPGSGSGADWGAVQPDEPISPSRLVAWIFRHEDGAIRIKR